MRALAVLALAACNGSVGTIGISLTTAPGSTVLDDASALRVTVTNPHDQQTIQRASNGSFDLELDLPADGTYGAIIVDALDANGDLVATGQSPAIPFGAIDASVVIYMAPPLSIGAAPVALTPDDQIAGGTLEYGAIFAGGTVAGVPTDAITIYNAYDHTLAAGLALPGPRAGLALGVGAIGVVYLFGGIDATMAPQDNLWRFDTRAAPNGAYVDFGEKAGFARADQKAVAIGGDQFVLTGSPVGEIAGLAGSVTSVTQVAALPPAGASVLGSDNGIRAVFAGPSGIVVLAAGEFTTLDASDHTGASAIALPDQTVLVACGTGAPAIVDPLAGTVTPITIQNPAACTLAVTTRYVLVLSGATADVYDTSLAHVTSITATARTGATAVTLPNDQVLIAGGGSTALELFTPDPTE